MFGTGMAYWVNGTEVAHVEPDDAFEIRLTKRHIRERRAELQGDPRVELRRNASDWISVRLSTPADVEFAVELVTIALEAHRAPPGTITKPPPSGTELERRRRFH